MFTFTRDGFATSASLDRLPRDVVFNLCDYLSTKDMVSLFRVNANLAKFGGKHKTSVLIHYDWTRRICNAMLWACRHGDVTFANSLMSYGYDLDEVDSIWLRASRKIKLRSPDKLLACLHEPSNGIDLSLLSAAVDFDQLDFVRFLFENSKESGNTPLEIKRLRRFGGEYGDSIRGRLTLLHLARSADMLRLLLAIRPDIPIDDEPITEYEPLLLWHIERGIDADSLSVLLREGARPDGALVPSHRLRLGYLRDCPCRTDRGVPSPQGPLEAAVYHSNIPAFRLLLDWGADFEYESDMPSIVKINLQYYLAVSLFSSKPDSDSSDELAEDILKICVSHGLDLQAFYKRRSALVSGRGQDTLPGHAIMRCDSASRLEVLTNLGVHFDLPIAQLLDVKSQHDYHGHDYTIDENVDPAFFLLRTFFRRINVDPNDGDPTFASPSFFQCLKKKLQILPRREKGAKDSELSILEYVVDSAPGCRLEATVLAVLGAYGSARLDRMCLRFLIRRVLSWGGTLHTARRLVETLICAGAPVYSQANQSSVLRRAFQIPIIAQPIPRTLDLVTGIRPVTDYEKETGIPAPTATEIWQRQDNAAAIMNLLIGHGAELKHREISAARRSGWVPPPESLQLQRLYAATGSFSTPTSTKGSRQEN